MTSLILLPIFWLKKSAPAGRFQTALKTIGAKLGGYFGAVTGGDFCRVLGFGCGCGVKEARALIALIVLAFLKAVLLNGWKPTGVCVNGLRAPSRFISTTNLKNLV